MTAAADIYCLQGGSTGCWRYDPTTNTWASLTAVPSTVGVGGSIAYDGSRYLMRSVEARRPRSGAMTPPWVSLGLGPP